VWYQLRRIYLSLGRRIAAQGTLSDPEDVFFLGTAEVEAALTGTMPTDRARQRVEARRRIWERTRRRSAPKFLRGYDPVDELEPDAADHVLQGVGASPGTGTGRARVVFDVRDLASLTDGDVLITRQTDPSWSTAFARITALVLETGGALAHGASLCREYDLPCVTAIDGASARIPDGTLVRVDGRRGTVELLDVPGHVGPGR
jgi:pyruvate,water dikinase